MSVVAFRYCDETGFGFSWVANEPATRTSHALLADGRVWLVDPVDWQPAIDRAVELGPPTGVLQLLDRHNRDCASVAARLGTQHLVVPTELERSPFEIVEIRRAKRWQEIALWWREPAALVVAEAIGTNEFFTAGSAAAGVHLGLRLTPPRTQLGRLRPEHLLVGHGDGLHGDAAAAGLTQALEGSRRGIPRVLAKLPGIAVDARRRSAS